MKKSGRPPKYKPIYCKKLIDFFDVSPTKIKKELILRKNGDKIEREVEVVNDLPTIIGFARSIKVTDTTIVAWTKKYPKFLAAYNWAKKLQEHIWMVNSLNGRYNPYFATIVGKNIFEWKDKTETEHSTKDDKPLTIKVISYKDKK